MCKDVYIYTLATVTVYIYTVTVARPYIILLILRSHLFFSLFSMHNKLLNNFSSPHLHFPQMLTNTPTQTNQHRDTQTHPQINKHTQLNQKRDRSVLDRNDRCLISACGTIAA